MKSLSTIGCEDRTVDAFLARLDANRVGLLVDVRALPRWRKRGISKNALAEPLERVGIAYAHRVALELKRGWRTFHLCFEADPAPCHRSRAAAAADPLGGQLPTYF